MLVLEAHAKVNLSLEVLGRRPDGYHELASVMQTVGLADTLSLRSANELTFTCSAPELSGPDNLVQKAAALLRERHRLTHGAVIHLEKRIPVAAGLGGGSSDAAAALVGLSRLWELPLACAGLRELAEALGSDVPYFLYGGTAMVRGRGEHVQRLTHDPALWYVLANPRVSVSTAAVFSSMATGRWSDGRRTESLAGAIEQGAAIRPGPNDLQEALFRLEPAARRCFEMVQREVPGRAFVSGSGPTAGAFFEDRAEAEAVGARLREHIPWVTVTASWIPERGETPCA